MRIEPELGSTSVDRATEEATRAKNQGQGRLRSCPQLYVLVFLPGSGKFQDPQHASWRCFISNDIMRLSPYSRPTILESGQPSDSTLPRPGMQCTTRLNIRTSKRLGCPSPCGVTGSQCPLWLSPYATQSPSSTASSAEALDNDVALDRDGFTFELCMCICILGANFNSSTCY